MDFDAELNYEMMAYGCPLDDYLPDDYNEEDDVMQILSEIADDCRERASCIGCRYAKAGECIFIKGMPDAWNLGGNYDKMSEGGQ